MIRSDFASLIDVSSSFVGALWPLDRAVAVNPLLDRLDDDFPTALSELERQLGVPLWPSRDHIAEAVRRGLGSVGDDDDGYCEETPHARAGTVLERSLGASSDAARHAQRMVGQVILEAVSAQGESSLDVLTRACAVLEDRASWVRGSIRQRAQVGALIRSENLEGLVGRIELLDDESIVAELSAHFARLPGWAAWAKWSDVWRRQPHPSVLSRRDFLTVSLAVDLAILAAHPGSNLAPPSLVVAPSNEAGQRRLRHLESMVHTPLLHALRTEAAIEGTPRWQIVMCIDVRSEPLRRALERSDDVETFGFAGFFGIPALVRPIGEREAHESLPVLVEPSVTVSGGRQRSDVSDAVVAIGGTFAELTHEPGAMFALAEGAGWLTAPWMLARSIGMTRARSFTGDVGEWALEASDPTALAEGALRTMGMTSNFASEVVFVGHSSSSRANTHYATLDCGACAGHAGGTNAIVLADLLNDDDVRQALASRGIDIPRSTRFLAGEHDTTTEEVKLFGGSSFELHDLFTGATNAVAMTRTGGGNLGRSRRTLRRRAGDWAEIRPEWGLAGNAAFVVAPRSSCRGAKLHGQCFLHSYDPSTDEDGSVLQSILTAPVVVAQWINASYYFSTVAPDVLGAGDKTLLNPVSDFGVISGDDPDLRQGLPWQSVASGNRPWHLPVRLLLAVEAPLARTGTLVRDEPTVRRLVEGEWIRLVGREGPASPWREWTSKHGWALS
ncbi:MAG: DUF2309 domain-containing protein [Acidobacteria bacterium]|nr:DUF2309 domain-containing protein [Acidobacteriota bacterium]